MTIQPGQLSAIGLCIEANWNVVPKTTDQVGITGTNPHRFFTCESDGGVMPKIDMNVPYDEVDGDISLRRTILQAKDYDGGFGFKADPEAMAYPTLGIFGKVTQTDLGVGSGAVHAYSKDFVPYVHAPSFTLESVFGDKTVGRLNAGYILNLLEFTYGRTIMCRMGGYAGRQIPNEYPNLAGVDTEYDFTNVDGDLPWQMNNGTESEQIKVSGTRNFVDIYPAYGGNGPLVHAKMKPGSITGFDTSDITTSGFVKINDVLVPYNQATGAGLKIQEGSTISIAREVNVFHVAGSGWDIGACSTGGIRVTGNMSFLYEDNTVPLAALAKKKISVNFKIPGLLIANNSVYYYMHEVYLPRIRFLDPGQRMANGGMTVPGDFVAEKDVSLGYEIKMTNVDTFSFTGLAGQESTNPGGLGGFVLA
jgi:hypothetical protein